MIVVKTNSFEFQPRTGFGPQEAIRGEAFSKDIKSYAVVLTGYSMRFHNGDHHIRQAQVKVWGDKIDHDVIEVKAQLGLRDDSGNWDDPYSGSISYAIIAEV